MADLSPTRRNDDSLRTAQPTIPVIFPMDLDTHGRSIQDSPGRVHKNQDQTTPKKATRNGLPTLQSTPIARLKLHDLLNNSPLTPKHTNILGTPSRMKTVEITPNKMHITPRRHSLDNPSPNPRLESSGQISAIVAEQEQDDDETRLIPTRRHSGDLTISPKVPRFNEHLNFRKRKAHQIAAPVSSILIRKPKELFKDIVYVKSRMTQSNSIYSVMIAMNGIMARAF